MHFSTNYEVFKYLDDMIAQLIRIDFSLIALFDQNNLNLAYVSGDLPNIHMLFPKNHQDIWQESLEQSMMQEDYTIANEQIFSPYFDEIGVKTWFSIPIAEEGKIYGIYFFGIL